MPAETTTQPMRTCPVCHGQFPITHHSTTQHTYCSRRCRDIAPTRPVLEPAATRPCPHCAEPITIVALLTTPEAARPQLPNPASDVIPIRRGG